MLFVTVSINPTLRSLVDRPSCNILAEDVSDLQETHSERIID